MERTVQSITILKYSSSFSCSSLLVNFANLIVLTQAKVYFSGNFTKKEGSKNVKTEASTDVRCPLATEPVREAGFGVVVQRCRHLWRRGVYQGTEMGLG